MPRAVAMLAKFHIIPGVEYPQKACGTVIAKPPVSFGAERVTETW